MNYDFINLFNSKTNKILSYIAVIGIIISSYTFYESSRNEKPDNTIYLINVSSGSESILEKIENTKLKEYNESLDSKSILLRVFEKPDKNSVARTSAYFLKFITGGGLFLLSYLIQILALLNFVKRNFSEISNKDILLRNGYFYYILLWIIPGIINMIIPLFKNIFINYLFIPSCLTLFFMLINVIYQDTKEKLA